ncbi:uncharacterized protein LOC116247835 isoform X1 [Nymphaea colorata]|nr:uncharacterized protein LOC116247835 isoform X1 [Nymphaea colorata]
MNFLLRSTQSITSEPPSATEVSTGRHKVSKSATLEGLISEEPLSNQSGDEDGQQNMDGFGTVGNDVEDDLPPKASSTSSTIKDHVDVSEEEGRIVIPCKELSEDWSDASSIHSFHSLDRGFVFPGEQFHILVCLSASRHETEVITPFRVAAVMSRSGSPELKASWNALRKGNGSNSVHTDEISANHTSKENGDLGTPGKSVAPTLDVSATEYLLRMEDHKQQTEAMLNRFKNSHFFVRVASSDEPLWCKKSEVEFSASSEVTGENNNMTGTACKKASGRVDFPSAVIERGSFNSHASGGVARNIERCCSLSNGDIVVLLQVNVGANVTKDPVLEVLQFEKDESESSQEIPENMPDSSDHDPCGNLLKWLLPLDRPLTPPLRPQLPPSLSSNLGSVSVSQRSTSSNTSSTPLFSFGNFRSYSMSSLPPTVTPPTPAIPSPSRPAFALEDWDHFLSQKLVKSKEVGTEDILSFRGVALEPNRFSVHCGLEGLYIPGRRWRRKIEIIQPVKIHSFASDCNTEDLLCVQIKNVVPEHVSDVVIFVDSINLIFEESSKGKPSVSLPIACIEPGDDHSLPNLALRRGEEHSFILKLAPSLWKDSNACGEKNLNPPSTYSSRKGISSGSDEYAVIVSCRSNYTESKLFFKHSTSWRPRLAKDLMISVASEMSEQNLGLSGGLSELPVQVLTLQASNLTPEDLTLTVLAPESFTSPSTVVSLNSAPSTPMGSFMNFTEFKGKDGLEEDTNSRRRSLPKNSEKENIGGTKRSVSFNQHEAPVEFLPDASTSCTHLWLQSRVPLGCVPSQSTATVRLELLPLTDGIITLDTLQIAVKEKDLVYVPESSLKIYSTSSIATSIA